MHTQNVKTAAPESSERWGAKPEREEITHEAVRNIQKER
jgi:hypothetical protein